MASQAPITQSIVVRSETSALNDVCKRILSELEAKGFNENNAFAVHLALEEAFVNALRHGNKMDPNKEIKIDYYISCEKVEISVTDEGEGFDLDGVPDPRSGENLYKTGGRGLLLIRSFMDEVDFNECGNMMHMVKHSGGEIPEEAGGS
jgi:serine/threonine-protein kinase RsbW